MGTDSCVHREGAPAVCVSNNRGAREEQWRESWWWKSRERKEVKCEPCCRRSITEGIVRAIGMLIITVSFHAGYFTHMSITAVSAMGAEICMAQCLISLWTKQWRCEYHWCQIDSKYKKQHKTQITTNKTKESINYMRNVHYITFYSSSFKDKKPLQPSKLCVMSASRSPCKPTHTWSKTQYSFQSIQHHTQTLTKRGKIIITTWKKLPKGCFYFRLDDKSPLFFHAVWISTLDHWTTCCTKNQMKWQLCL